MYVRSFVPESVVVVPSKEGTKIGMLVPMSDAKKTRRNKTSKKEAHLPSGDSVGHLPGPFDPPDTFPKDNNCCWCISQEFT